VAETQEIEMRPTALGAAALLIATASPAFAQDEEQSTPLPDQSAITSSVGELRLQVVARGLEHPWGLALLPDGRALVTERNAGTLRFVEADGTVSAPVAGVPAIFRYEGETDRSQAGLFDVKLSPEFSSNQRVYLSLAAPTDRGATVRVVRGRLEGGDRPSLTEVEEIFTMQEPDQDSSGLHFGGRMALYPQTESLFLTVGERRNISRSQDGEDQAGSILRMTLDGAVPADNPFVGDEEVNDFIFAKGSRNSQALTLDASGRLWSVEHGPLGGDRVDLVEAGANLGWPFLTGGRDYSGAPLGAGLSHEGMVSPLHVFAETVAPSDAAFYSGAMFAGWQGNLLVGGLANESLMRLEIGDAGVSNSEAIDVGRRIRDVQIAQDGAIWMITEHEDGEVLRLSAG
jgi:aldose sugar dehydrogenase